MSRHQRLLIFGYYGFGNVGDEAVLDALMSHLRQSAPGVSCTVVSNNPTETRFAHQVESIHWQDMDAVVEAARQSDGLIIGGGGLFHDYEGLDVSSVLTGREIGIPYYASAAILARLFHLPLMMYAVGVGPLFAREARSLTRAAFEIASVATVRDTESATIVKDLGLVTAPTVTADPALLVTPISSAEARALLVTEGLTDFERPRIAVSLRPWAFGIDQAQWMKEVADALDQLVYAHNAQIVFTPFQAMDQTVLNDGAVSREVAELMRHGSRAIVLRREYSPAAMAGIFGECQYVIGMRLHATLLSAIVGVPSVGIAYDRKVSHAHAILGTAGHALDIQTLTASRLYEAVDLSAATRADRVARLREATQRASELAKVNNRTVDEFVAGVHDALPLVSPETAGIIESATVSLALNVQDWTVRARELVDALGVSQAHAQDLADELGATQAQAQDLANELGASRAQAKGLNAKLKAMESSHATLASELEATRERLNFYYSTRAWRWSSAYWRMRADGVRGYARFVVRSPYYAVRGVYHLTFPRAFRERQWAKRHARRTAKPSPNSREYAAGVKSATKALNRIIAENSGARGVLVLPPSCPWHTPLFQRPQQMAIAFARLGYLVIYWEDVLLVAPDKRFEKIQDRVYVANVPPEVLQSIKSPLSIAYTYNYNWVETLNQPRVVYEYIDHLDIFIDHQPEFLAANHGRVMKQAEVTVGTADDLVATLLPDRSDTILVPNGVDYDFFANPPRDSVPDDMRDLIREGKPIVGYYGAIAEWFDFDLMRYLANAMPDVDFVVIGPAYAANVTESIAELEDLPNVYMLGQRDYRTLPGYLRTFSVATIPFQLSEAIQAVSPIKLFEYMAGGKPIVTSDMVECRKYPEVLIAKSPEEWVTKLREAIALGQDPAYVERVRARSLQNTWVVRAETIVEALNAKSTLDATKREGATREQPVSALAQAAVRQ